MCPRNKHFYDDWKFQFFSKREDDVNANDVFVATKRQKLVPFPRVGKRQALIPFPRTGKRSSAESGPTFSAFSRQNDLIGELWRAAQNNPEKFEMSNFVREPKTIGTCLKALLETLEKTHSAKESLMRLHELNLYRSEVDLMSMKFDFITLHQRQSWQMYNYGNGYS